MERNKGCFQGYNGYRRLPGVKNGLYIFLKDTLIILCKKVLLKKQKHLLAILAWTWKCFVQFLYCSGVTGEQVIKKKLQISLFRRSFHLLKKNEKLLRELRNLDSRQW